MDELFSILARTALFTALLVSASLATGCCCIDRVYRPTGCDANWDPLLGSCGGGGDCGGIRCACSPGQRIRQNLTCNAGCGEIYWGEWTSDPPDACDPCDGCGNWTGPRCCPPGLLDCLCRGLSALLCGGRGRAGCSDIGSECTSCNALGQELSGGEHMPHGEVLPPKVEFPKPAQPLNRPPPQPKPDLQTRHMQPRTSVPNLLGPHQHRGQHIRPANGTSAARQRSI